MVGRLPTPPTLATISSTFFPICLYSQPASTPSATPVQNYVHANTNLCLPSVLHQILCCVAHVQYGWKWHKLNALGTLLWVAYITQINVCAFVSYTTKVSMDYIVKKDNNLSWRRWAWLLRSHSPPRILFTSPKGWPRNRFGIPCTPLCFPKEVSHVKLPRNMYYLSSSLLTSAFEIRGLSCVKCHRRNLASVFTP